MFYLNRSASVAAEGHATLAAQVVFHPCRLALHTVHSENTKSCRNFVKKHCGKDLKTGLDRVLEKKKNCL